jgi:hypothetical protein
MWKKAVQINGKDKKYQNFHVVVHLLQLLEPNPRVIKRKKKYNSLIFLANCNVLIK